MNPFIDSSLTPFLLGLGDWSWRWGVMLVLLMTTLAVCRLRRASTRHLVCRGALVIGLFVPFLPRWGPSLIPIREPVGHLPSLIDKPTLPASVGGSQLIGKAPGKRHSEVVAPNSEIGAGAAPAANLPMEESLGLLRTGLLCLTAIWVGGILLLAGRRIVGKIAPWPR